MQLRPARARGRRSARRERRRAHGALRRAVQCLRAGQARRHGGGHPPVPRQPERRVDGRRRL